MQLRRGRPVAEGQRSAREPARDGDRCSHPRKVAPQLRDAGFEHIRMDAYPFATIQLIPDAYGGSLVPLLEQYVAEQGGMSQEEATA